MKREDITALGVTDKDLIDKIMDLHGGDVTKLQNSITTLTTDRDGLKTQLGEANTKLSGYDPDWKTKATTAEQDAQKKIDAMKFDYALDGALKGAKARDAVAVKAHLQADALKLDGDNILGLKEQLEKVKTDSPFLFEDEKPAPKFSTATPGIKEGTQTTNDKINAALRGAFGGKE